MRLLPSLMAVVLLASTGWTSEWKLVWSDEFDREGLPDPAKWSYEEGFVRNRELQYYTAGRTQNARVEQGHLIIEAHRESFPNARYRAEAPERRWQERRERAEYTSASLTTRGRASWTYGRIEVRARVPSGRGTWPAIWTLGTNLPAVGWPACGEIDIMEYVGHEPGVIHANVHTRGFNHARGNGRGARLTVPDAEQTFHVYAVEWTPEKLEFYVDDRSYFVLENDGKGVDAWPFDAPQYLILNLAIGGAWGGQQGVDEAIFPQRLTVDYVRIYERRDATAAAPVVVAEEEVYPFTPPNNGSGPMWCSGSTCLVRLGERVVASGIETLPAAKPLNNLRWTLYERTGAGWQRRAADPEGRTREPSPLAVLAESRLMLSVNPTLVADPQVYAGPARPAVLEFAGADLGAPFRQLTPRWQGTPAFTEHSYRSFAADGPAGEAILLQNIGYTHAEWSFFDRTGEWSAQGRLPWPTGTNEGKAQPIRVCYPNVLLRDRAAYFCGVSDIIEPNPAWRAFKKELTGQEWDYDFRRLFFTWTPDVTREPFRPWIELASREETCGWISPGDLWLDTDGAVHVLWTERALDERLRERFFPQAQQSHSLRYAVLREGRVTLRRTLLEAVEGGGREVPSAGRFHATPDGRLWVVCYVSGVDREGRGVSENRLYPVGADGTFGAAVVLPFRKPFTSYFTATPRAGNAPSWYLDLLGHQAGQAQTISYGCVRLGEPPRAGSKASVTSIAGF